MSELIHRAIPLSQLVIDQTNARSDSLPDADIDTLAASIGTVGLLQPILVVARGDEFGIVAGRRRFLAMLRLTGQEELDPPRRKGTIAAIQIDAEQALDASLAENYVRLQMDERELYGAFRRLAETGRTPAEIAEQLGYEEARVKRILRLSTLHPELMEAWVEGDIGIVEAQAFVFSDDPELQLRVAKKARKDYCYSNDKNRFRLAGYAHLIRRQIKEAMKGKDFDSKKLAYLGLDEYKKAGGRLTEDLFSDDIMILDPELLDNLADTKLEEEKAEALTKMIRETVDAPLDVEWVDRDQLPQINLYGYDQLDDACAIHPVITGEGEKAVAILPDGGKILAEAYLTHDGKSSYKLYWASREAGGIAPPKQKSHKTTTPAETSKSPGQLLKEASGAPSRNGFFALQVLFGDMVAEGLLVDATETVDRSEVEGLYNFLFACAWSLARRGMVGGFPCFHSPERGPHQVREILGEGEYGSKELDELLPDAAWLNAPTVVEAFDSFWSWISSKNAARLGAALLGQTWSPIVNNFSEQEQPLLVRLVAEHANTHFNDLQWTQQHRDWQLSAIDMISHKARLEAMRSWGVPEDQLKPLRKATSAAFMAKILEDEDRHKLLGMDDDQWTTAKAWLPEPMRLPTVERPKPKAEKPKAKAKAKKKEVEPA